MYKTIYVSNIVLNYYCLVTVYHYHFFWILSYGLPTPSWLKTNQREGKGP